MIELASWVLWAALANLLYPRRKLWFTVGQSETQVTTWVCAWHLQWRAVWMNWTFNLWNLMLSPGRWCQHWTEFSDTLLVWGNSLLWGSLLHTLKLGPGNPESVALGPPSQSLSLGHIVSAGSRWHGSGLLWWPLPYEVIWDLGDCMTNACLYYGFWASLVPQTVKNLLAMQDTQVRSLGQENPLEKGMATHFSVFLPWEFQTEVPSQLLSMGSQRLGHDWASNVHTHHGFHFPPVTSTQHCL